MDGGATCHLSCDLTRSGDFGYRRGQEPGPGSTRCTKIQFIWG